MSAESLPQFIERRYGIKVRSAARLRHGLINDNYLITSSSGQYLFKSYRTRTRRQAKFELLLLERLARASFPSPKPVRDKEDSLVVLWNGRPGVLLTYLNGSMLMRPKLADVENIGELLGRMHRFLRSVPETASRERWDPPEIARFIKQYAARVAKRPFRGAATLSETVQREFAALSFPRRLPTGITHQDVKQENIIRSPQGALGFIDFDNAYRGVLLYDFMTPVIWMCFNRRGIDFGKLRALLAGYESERSLTAAEREHFFGALAFRLLREAFVWPMRWLDAKEAPRKGLRFLHAYRAILKKKSIVEKIAWAGYN